MNVSLLLLCIVGCELVGIISGFFTIKSVKIWYKKLKKPSFNPPSSIFGPVWTMLYAVMGISLYLILTNPQKTTFAVLVFLLQLLLNFFWSFIFFSLRKLTLAFIEICMLLMVIIVTIIVFWPINYVASLLLVPYVVWVSFATLLTYSIRMLNKT